MKYEEWSKSIELDRTLTPDFSAAKWQKIGIKGLSNKKDTKLTNGSKVTAAFFRVFVRSCYRDFLADFAF